MSGIVSGMNYDALFAPAGSQDPVTAILNAIYDPTPVAPATNFASTGSSILDLKLAQQDQAQDVVREALVPQVSQAIASFKSAVGSAKTLTDALANPAIQTVLLTATGLSKYIGETALVQKAFLSNPSDPSSLVNQLGDGTLLSVVSQYDFAQSGLASLQNASTISALSAGYATALWRQGLDQASPGLSNAMTFLSQAASIKSASDILSNATNFYVVMGALGIPTNIVFQDQAAQDQTLNARLDYSKFQDPTYVTQLAQQYLISQQSAAGSSAVQSASILA